MQEQRALADQHSKSHLSFVCPSYLAHNANDAADNAIPNSIVIVELHYRVPVPNSRTY